jgi:hypothetical protein
LEDSVPVPALSIHTKATFSEINEVKKFRRNKWGQLQIPSEEETEDFSKDERWTVRPVFVVVVAILCAAAVIFQMLSKP